MPETPDSHDLDKLNRWHEGLRSESGESDGGFPVCALFLASGEDRRAHDIFRVYRTAFEGLGADFHDLVIFGQHGLSSTCSALKTGLGLSSLQTPSLVLISVTDGGHVFHTTGLPAGALAPGKQEEDSGEVPWKMALEAIKRSVEEGSELSLNGVKGLERSDFSGGSLSETVAKVKLQLEAAN